jgi:hypothetical protein
LELEVQSCSKSSSEKAGGFSESEKTKHAIRIDPGKHGQVSFFVPLSKKKETDGAAACV